MPIFIVMISDLVLVARMFKIAISIYECFTSSALVDNMQQPFHIDNAYVSYYAHAQLRDVGSSMKYIFFIMAALVHLVLSADSITFVQSQQAWKNIFSDGAAKIDSHNDNSTHTMYVSNPISLSTHHKTFSHHTSTPHYNLNCMNTQQLAWYFAKHGYTEGEILSNPLLYMNAAYLTLVKQLPRYSAFVEKYYKKYRAYSRPFKIWETIHFRYIAGLAKQFARLHWECQQKRQTQEAQHSATQQSAINISDQCYIIHPTAVLFAREYGITEQQLMMINSEAHEQQLHNEFLEQLDEARTISAYYAVQKKNILIDAVGHGVAIGIEANNLHQLDIAAACARFGRQVLEVIEGVGEGIVLFAENNVHMIRYPIHTLKQVVHCLGQVTGTCTRTIGTVAYWHELMERGDGLLMAQEMDDVANQIVVCGILCAEKLATMPSRDIAKNATAIAADVLLTHRMFTLCGNLCAQAAPVVRDTITAINNRIPHINEAIVRAYDFARTESPVLQTAEGILIKASKEVNKVSGVAVEIINDVRLTLETIHADYMVRLELEMQTLRLLYDNKIKGFAEFSNKYLKIDYKHIFGMNLEFSRRGMPQIGGFHQDFMQAIENSNLIKFANKVMYENGCYKADLVYNGESIKRAATFFPSDWPREKVIAKIYEAYDQFLSAKIPYETTRDQKYLIKGLTSEGIKVEMYITKSGKVVTAYPAL